MTTIKAFVKSHPLLSYFAVVFAISSGGLLIAVGREGYVVEKKPDTPSSPNCWPRIRSRRPQPNERTNQRPASRNVSQ